MHQKFRYLLGLFALVAALLPATPVHADVATDFLRLDYAAVGIHLPIFEGQFDSGGLTVPYQPVAAWHYPGMAWPGQGNRSLFFAHDQPNYFVTLAYAQVGDRIYVTRTEDGRSIGYTVTANMLIQSTDLSLLAPNPDGFDQLVLLTCTSWSESDPRRVVIATADRLPPSPPENVRAVAGANSAAAYWDPPNFSGYDGPTYYTITASPGGQSATVAASNHSGALTGLTPGVSYTLSVSAGNSVGSGTPAGANPVTPYPALRTSASPSAVTAGIPTSVTVSAVDSNGGVVTSYGASVVISSDDPQAVLPGVAGAVSVSGGTGSYPLTLKTAGTRTIRATDAGQPAMTGSATVSVSPAQAAGFRLTTPGLIPEGTPSQVSVSPVDAFGNLQPAYGGTVHLAATPVGAATAGADHTFIPADGGVAGFSVLPSPAAVGTSPTLTATVSGSTLSGSVTVRIGYTYYFTWFDRISSPGFLGDNLHVINPNGTQAWVSVRIPAGFTGPCPDQYATIQPHHEATFSCANGFGGPASVVANLPVQASQRVQYYGSFNEVSAQPFSAADTDLVFTWFDRISDPGFLADNLHIVNPSSQTAQVTVRIPTIGGYSCPDQLLSIPPGEVRLATCAQGFGGPVTVISTNGVKILASQRVQYYGSFNEVAAQGASGAAGNLEFTWFDRISDPGFAGDNIHVVNPSSTTDTTVLVRIPAGFTGPCADQRFTIHAGQEAYFSCGNGFGGPVTVTVEGGGPGVIASQRVRYYQSFNEVAAQDEALGQPAMSFSWFDRISSPGFRSDNVHVLNPDPVNPVDVLVHIEAGFTGPCPDQPAHIPGGQEAIFTCGNGFGGPVTVTVQTLGMKVLASQRVQYYQSFNEVPAPQPGT